MALDIKPIEVIKNDLIRLQAETTLKDTVITSLAAEKTTLLREKKVLSEALVTAQTTVEAVQGQSSALKQQLDSLAQETSQVKNELAAKTTALSAREKEVSELQEKNALLLKKGITNETVLTELAELRIQNDFHKNQLLARNQYLQQISLELENVRSAHARIQTEKDGIEKVLIAEQGKRTALEQDLSSLKGRSEFSASEVSGYLNDAIDTFNSQKNLTDSNVNYIISELEVDLKAGIGTTSGSNLTMLVPSRTQLTEQGLSSFKFTIRAIPQSAEQT